MPPATDTSELATSRPPAWRLLIAYLMLGCLLACAVEIGRMVVGRNTHVVVPDRVYRSAQLTPAQLDAFVRERLSPPKRPKAWHELPDLPRTLTGKVLRQELPRR